MFVWNSEIPVSIYQSCIRIVITENTVWDPAYPDISLVMLPAFYLFCTGDHSTKRLSTDISDTGIFSTGMNRIYIFPVNPGATSTSSPGRATFAASLIRLKWSFNGTIAVSRGIHIYIVFHDTTSGYYFINNKMGYGKLLSIVLIRNAG
jgi:hypothetical protein